MCSQSQWPGGKGMNCLCSIEHWDHGFESHPRHGCLCFYSVFVLSCVQVAALQQADHSSKEFYRLCKRSRKLKNCQVPRKGCRAIDSKIFFIYRYGLINNLNVNNNQWCSVDAKAINMVDNRQTYNCCLRVCNRRKYHPTYFLNF
jgi:hypothetical protein